MEWKHLGSPRSKKFKMVKSAGKVMATVFWDGKGVLLVDFMEKGTTINAASYCANLEQLQTAIKRQCPGLLATGVLLLHDNAWPHIATATQKLLQRFRWTILDHPPYSPDLAPSDFHLFPAPKDHHSGHKFASDDVKTAVTGWVKSQGTEFYKAGINTN
jgi:histone-lysine N-methyltransferase SETMAR